MPRSRSGLHPASSKINSIVLCWLARLCAGRRKLAPPLRRLAPPLRRPAQACATLAPPKFSWWRKFCVPAPFLRHFRAAQIGGAVVGYVQGVSFFSYLYNRQETCYWMNSCTIRYNLMKSLMQACLLSSQQRLFRRWDLIALLLPLLLIISLHLIRLKGSLFSSAQRHIITTTVAVPPFLQSPGAKLFQPRPHKPPRHQFYPLQLTYIGGGGRDFCLMSSERCSIPVSFPSRACDECGDDTPTYCTGLPTIIPVAELAGMEGQNITTLFSSSLL